MEFPHLSSPITIGSVTIKNRALQGKESNILYAVLKADSDCCFPAEPTGTVSWTVVTVF